MNLQVEQMHPLVLNVGLAVHNADWNWKNVNSPFTRLYYVTEGSAQIELPDGIYTLSPKHMYFIPAFTIHTNICKSNFVHYYLHIYEDHYSDNDWLDHWKFPVEIEATDLDLALFKRLCEINAHDSAKVRPYHIRQQSNTHAESYKKQTTGIFAIRLNREESYSNCYLAFLNKDNPKLKWKITG